MSSVPHPGRAGLVSLIQIVANGCLLVAAIALVGATLAGAFGLLPFVSLPLQFGETALPHGGMAIQIVLSVIMLAILAALPAGRRVTALERSHRDFSICMADVAEAYRICHAADRSGAFKMSSEFDAVKERILFLRSHPKLGSLEPDVLEAAAEMSQASHELASIYGDENVARARDFLVHRQEECALFASRIEEAETICRDLERHLQDIGREEDAMERRLAELTERHGETLRTLGFVRHPGTVVAMPPKFAAE